MLKYVLSAALLMAASVAAAESAPASTSASNTSNLPVIVKNEPIGPNLCRLHFEDTTTKDVACDSVDNKKS